MKTAGVRTAVVLLIIAIGVVYFFIDPGRFSFMPRCFFKWLTGWNCPACGVQRAAHAVLHGRFSEAAHYNFFLFLSVPYLFLLVLERWFLGPRAAARLGAVLFDRRLVLTYLVLVILWWVGRNILGI